MAYSTHNVSEMQKEIAPAVYGGLNLDIKPERFRTEVDSKPRGFMRAIDPKTLEKFLQDPKEVELFRQLTLMGDPIADALAAKIPEIGMKRMREMLDQALEQGIESVQGAPAELVALIRDMEKIPEWLDWERVDRFHRRMRVVSALTQDYMMRLAFMMTYANGYSGLPMIMTGQLTGPSAAGRMKETTSTFRMSTLPNALRRNGEAFKSAAKVRMMHAVVRVSLLKNKERWDYEVYGTPIPQVDQMGAALWTNFILTLISIKLGRPLGEFELDAFEAWRYLAYLLGMHDYFLGKTRKDIVKSWSLLGATLRDKIDPRAVELNKATLYAYTRSGHSLLDKLLYEVDVRNTRYLYTQVMGKEMAAELGVRAHPTDVIATAVLGASLAAGVLGAEALRFVPGGDARVEAWAVARIRRLLEKTGEAKYATDESSYSLGEKKQPPKRRKRARARKPNLRWVANLLAA